MQACLLPMCGRSSQTLLNARSFTCSTCNMPKPGGPTGLDEHRSLAVKSHNDECAPADMSTRNPNMSMKSTDSCSPEAERSRRIHGV